jgi:hypothetical protein
MSTCRACGAPIRWARTAKGKAIPLDPDPAEAGNVILEEPFGADPIAHVIGSKGVPLELGHLAELPRFMPHHATCPEWGKR